MDVLDERQHEVRIMPVPDELTELRRSVAAIVELDPGPMRLGLAPGLMFTGSSLLDFKGSTRPEKFDGSSERWLDWKEGFQSSMELLNVTPYLLAIDRMVEQRVRQVDGGGPGSYEVDPHDLEELLGKTREVHLQAR